MDYTAPQNHAGNFIGCKWKIYTRDDGILEGTLSNYNPSNTCFTFEKVYFLNDDSDERKNFISNIRIFFNDIEDAKIIDDENKVDRYAPRSKKDDFNDYCVPNLSTSFLNNNNNNNSNNNNPFVDEDDDDDEQIENSKLFSVEVEDDVNEKAWRIDLRTLSRPASNLVAKIDNKDYDCYDDILLEIGNSHSIGLYLSGKKISRFDEIDYILISTLAGNYVFNPDCDVINDLKPILESETILKIVYDSRLLADALKHRHRIVINNVFDCQVMDYYIQNHEKQIQGSKQLIKKFRTYTESIRDYLGINLYIDKNDYKLLSRTPLSLAGESYVRKQIMLLRELNDTQTNLFLHKVRQSMFAQLNCYREANDVEYKSLIEAEDHVYKMFDCSHLLNAKQTNIFPYLTISNIIDESKKIRLLNETVNNKNNQYKIRNVTLNHQSSTMFEPITESLDYGDSNYESSSTKSRSSSSSSPSSSSPSSPNSLSSDLNSSNGKINSDDEIYQTRISYQPETSTRSSHTENQSQLSEWPQNRTNVKDANNFIPAGYNRC